MKKNTFTTVQLTKGGLHIYDFGAIKLHACKAVIIESPCFFDNNAELAEYLKDTEVE